MNESQPRASCQPGDKNVAAAQCRHAYLIMAHHEFGFLEELLKTLDDPRNDIYMHIDRKVKAWPEEKLRSAIIRGNLYVIEPIKVNWGGYSQIACELKLMENAAAQGPYAYYHLLTGVSFPLKSQDVIHWFFDEHHGLEFVGFDEAKDYGERLKNIHLFNEMGKATTPYKRLLLGIRSKFLKLQKRAGYSIRLSRGITIKKGLVYWSITHDAVLYLLNQKARIQKMFRHSLCGDEVFVHTLLYNSPFREKLSPAKTELDACLRDVKPSLSYGYTAQGSSAPGKERGRQENVYTFTDLADMLASNRLFALKFGGPEAVALVREFKRRRDTGE